MSLSLDLAGYRLRLAEEQTVSAATDLLHQELHRAHRGIPKQLRKQSGAFFTPTALARKAASLFNRPFSKTCLIVDPTCGAGDLLLACAERLPKASTLGKTLDRWSKCIAGTDINIGYVKTAQARLGAAAALRFRSSPPSVAGDFSMLVRGSVYTSNQLQLATHIILNPPFTTHRITASSGWGSGRTSEAASITLHCIEKAMPGTEVVAILPDTLRCGPRYARWRKLIAELAVMSSFAHGRFSKDANVDVFLLYLVKRDQRNYGVSTKPKTFNSKTLAGNFQISIGPVVDYRRPPSGAWHRYLVAKSLPVGGRASATAVVRKTRWAGKLKKPPFIVVDRTSNPADAVRAKATLITGREPLAVENHLIVIEDKKRRPQTLRRLVQHLVSARTTAWLNRRNRSRHLTKSILGAIQWVTR